MKRDMDLIREILLVIEKQSHDLGWVDLKINNYTSEEASYHVMLLSNAGFIEADNVSTMGKGNSNWKPKRLTWQGHEFLDAARDNSTWEKAKKTIAKNGGSFTIELLIGLLVNLAKQKLGI